MAEFIVLALGSFVVIISIKLRYAIVCDRITGNVRVATYKENENDNNRK